MSEREDLVNRAKLAEQCERFEEMVESMTDVAKMDAELNVEERNLFSVSFKNAIGARRSSWRIMTNIESKSRNDGGQKFKLVGKMRAQLEKELGEICQHILSVLDENVIPKASTVESKVFYYKMKGDYQRYNAEFASGEDRNKAAEASLHAYKEATKIAEGLPATHPIRLGLALNFSVFYYEILNSPQRACELAEKAFSGALNGLETLSEESYKDSTLIMQLLRDNLTLWTPDLQTEGEPEASNEQAAAAPEASKAE